MTTKSKPTRLKATQFETRTDDVLMQQLLHRARVRQHTLKQLSSYLGISYERLTQLRARNRPFTHTSRDVLRKVGSYLGIPVVLVLAHAGHIQLTDFAWPEPSTSKLEDALRSLQSDPLFGAFVPRELETAHPAVQLLVVFLYERLTTEPRAGWRAAAWLTELEGAIAAQAQSMDGQAKDVQVRKTVFP